MFCSNCGFKLEDGTKFCPNCGASQIKEESALETPIVVQQESNTNAQTNVVVKIGFCKAVKLYFANLFNFNGRSTRGEYWWSFLFNLIVWGILLVTGGKISDDYLLSFLIILMILVTSSIRVRRLHDTGLIGFTEFLLIPSALVVLIGTIINNDDILGIGVVIAFIGAILSCILALKKSSQKENKWGENIRMQTAEKNASLVPGKKIWLNVVLNTVAVAAMFVAGLALKNSGNASAGSILGTEVTQKEAGQSASNLSTEQSGRIWTDNYPVGQWVEHNNYSCYIFKKDAKNQIYMALENEDWSRSILALFIFSEKGNTELMLSRPPAALMPSDERKAFAEKFIRIVNKNINKSYENFVEVMKNDSCKLLMETAVIKPGYRTVTKTTFRTQTLIEGGSRTLKDVPVQTLAEERDPSQDMHVRPFKIVLGGENGKTRSTSFNNLPIQIIEYYGEF